MPHAACQRRLCTNCRGDATWRLFTGEISYCPCKRVILRSLRRASSDARVTSAEMRPATSKRPEASLPLASAGTLERDDLAGLGHSFGQFFGDAEEPLTTVHLPPHIIGMHP